MTKEMDEAQEKIAHLLGRLFPAMWEKMWWGGKTPYPLTPLFRKHYDLGWKAFGSKNYPRMKNTIRELEEIVKGID